MLITRRILAVSVTTSNPATFAVPLVGTRRRRVVLWVLLGAVTAASFAWSVHATSASPTTS